MTSIEEIAARLEASSRYPAAQAFDKNDIAYLLEEVKRLGGDLDDAREVNAGSNCAYLDQMCRAESAEALALSLAEALESVQAYTDGDDGIVATDLRRLVGPALSDPRLLKLRGKE